LQPHLSKLLVALVYYKVFRPVVLNLWGIPHWWRMRSCQVGNDRSYSRTTAL